MKKAAILLLCLMMFVGAATAEEIKVFSYTIPELIARQLTSNTSMRVNVTAETTGSAPDFADAALWQQLQQALPAMKISGTYMLRKSSGNMQLTAQLIKGEETLSGLTVTGQGNDYLLESDLLPGLTLALPRETSALINVLSNPEEGEWPSLVRMAAAIEAAGEEYALQLEEALAPHMNALNTWLRKYTDMQMAHDATGSLRPVQTVRVPAADMKKQIKQFMRNLYADQALLALLGSVVSPVDAAAYLENGMLPLFEAAVDASALEGEVLVLRRYDAEGLLANEEITLPFVPGTGLKTIRFTSDRQSAANSFAAEVVFSSGFGMTVTAESDAQGAAYKGTVTAMQSGETVFSARYTLQVNLGAETYDASVKGKERRQSHEAVLTVEPVQENAFHKQQLTFALDFIAGASSTNPAYCYITLNWQDLEGDSAVTLNIKNNTSAPLRLSEKDEGSAVRLENLSVQDLREWLGDTAGSIVNGLREMLSRSLTTENMPQN